MPVVIVKMPRGATSLSAEMTGMRSWLDAHRCSPSKFECHLLPDKFVIRAEFNDAEQAAAFQRQFDGNKVRLISPKGPPSRETMQQVFWWRLTAEAIRAEVDGFTSESARKTMSQVAQSYDRMAEDLERRLGKPRYRDGLIVSGAGK